MLDFDLEDFSAPPTATSENPPVEASSEVETPREQESGVEEPKSSDDIAINSETATDSDSVAEPESVPKEKPAELKSATRKTNSSHIRLNEESQELLQSQSKKYGINQNIYLMILINRNAEGADEKEFLREVKSVRKYAKRP